MKTTYRTEKDLDKMTCKFFETKRKEKLVRFYKFKTIEKMEEYIENQIKIIKRRKEKEEERKEKKKQKREKAKKAIKIGSLFYNSRGYEQTNIDYYQVIEKKGSKIKLKPIAGEMVEIHNHDSGICKPCKNVFIEGKEEITKIITGKFLNMKIGFLKLIEDENQTNYKSWGY